MQLGATDAVENIGQATQLAQELTNGQGADNAIITVGVTRGEHIGQAFDAVRKGGTVAIVGIGPVTDMNIPVSPFILTLFQKRLQGVLYGAMSPSKDILRLLSMYQAGQLKLKELVTRTYTLDQVNEGYADMHRRPQHPRRHHLRLTPRSAEVPTPARRGDLSAPPGGGSRR